MIPFVLRLAFSFRLDLPYIPRTNQYWIFLAAPLIAIPIFIRMGLYRAIIRYIGFHTLWAVLKSVALYALLWSLLVLLAKVDSVPRSVYILNLLLSILCIDGNGLAMSRPGYIKHKNVVIYGEGAAGMQLAVAISMSKELKLIAFIDDTPALHNLHINGLKVHGFFSPK